MMSIGLLATVFPDVMVEAALDACDAREVRTRALPLKCERNQFGDITARHSLARPCAQRGRAANR
jgi:Insertion element 4 transposase N-terminal